MAAYRRVDDLRCTVTCGLTACTPGSAPGPTLGIEYGKAFTFTFTSFGLVILQTNIICCCDGDSDESDLSGLID